MAESRTIGGTCVIEGCPGSNNLIEAAKPCFDARHPRYPGLALTDEDLRANSRQLVAQKNDAVEGYRQKKYQPPWRSWQHCGGPARFLDAHTVHMGC
jgi:pyruvate/2-oxoglutarate dehydrogenase complex dihydrolipoamide dehydrogenase (E3) component